jgi:hypothetical protein
MAHAKMNSALRVTAFVTALALVFAAGVVTAVVRQWGQPMVTVSVENKSGGLLSNVEVAFRSTAANGVLHMPTIPHGESMLGRFYLRGEGSYTVKVTLATGRVLTSTEGYVESGYRTTEIVRETEIQSASGYSLPPQ